MSTFYISPPSIRHGTGFCYDPDMAGIMSPHEQALKVLGLSRISPSGRIRTYGRAGKKFGAIVSDGQQHSRHHSAAPWPFRKDGRLNGHYTRWVAVEEYLYKKEEGDRPCPPT